MEHVGFSLFVSDSLRRQVPLIDMLRSLSIKGLPVKRLPGNDLTTRGIEVLYLDYEAR